jgi:hypothetical protein
MPIVQETQAKDGKPLKTNKFLYYQTFLKLSKFSRIIDPDILDKLVIAFGIDISTGLKSIVQLKKFIGFICFMNF